MNTRLVAHVHRMALRDALTFRSWSYDDLARAAGVSKGTVSNLANGTRTHTTPETAVKIARAVGVDRQDLFTLKPATRASHPAA